MTDSAETTVSGGRADVAPIAQSLLEELERGYHGTRASAVLDLEPLVATGDTSALDLVLARLVDGHPAVRVAASDVLAEGPPNLVQARLLETLENLAEEQPGVRSSVVSALGKLPLNDALQGALVAEAANSDADVRFQALVGLNLCGASDSSFEACVRTSLSDRDDEVAAVAAGSAADLGMDDVGGAIVERWRTARGFAHRHFALAAAHLGQQEVIPSLERTVRAGVEAIEAIEALERLSSPGQEACRQLARSWRVHPLLRIRLAVGVSRFDSGSKDAGSKDAGSKDAESARKQVQKWLKHRRPDLRAATLQAIGHCGATELGDLSVAALTDKVPDVALEAVNSLEALGDERARAALAEAAEHHALADVRSMAEAAIGRLEDSVHGEEQVDA